MPRAEAGSAKAIGNAIKAKGLTKLRFYCQICQKACRDENGYKCHIESEAHMRQMAAIGPNAAKTIDNFSREFQDGFVQLLSRRFGTRRIKANQVYQEYIAERHHTHMNATRWVSLSEFVKHLGREGIAHVEEMNNGSEYGWYISWIDNSPAALKRQDALQKMERAKVDEEGRARKFLKEQIERAKEEEERKKQASESEDKPTAEEGLQKGEERKPIKLGISLGSSSSLTPSAGAASASGSTSTVQKPVTTAPTASPSPFKLGNNPLKMKVNPSASASSKPINPLKMASSSSTSAKSSSSSSSGGGGKPPSHATMAERIMQEEQERKEKRKLMGPQPSAKRMRL